jgi:hypothetical protein
MKTQRQKTGFRGAIAIFTVSLFVFPCLGDRMGSQTAWATPSLTQVIATGFTPPPPPPERDAPGNRGGGAGRSCAAGEQSVTALMPEYQQALISGGAITKVWGTATTERPTFWFDLPYEKSTLAALEFVLQDNSSPAKDLYRGAIVPPDTPGIISISLPATVAPLEVGKLYKWFFKVRLQCHSGASAAKPQIQKEELYGWVQRVSPSPALINQLKQATPQQQASLYAQNGIWFDALTTLGKLHLANPQDAQLRKDWNDLLQSVGLEELTTKPLFPCCRARGE